MFPPRCGKSVVKSDNMSEPVSFIAMMPQTVPSPPSPGISLSSIRIRRKIFKSEVLKETNTYFVKVDTKGPMTISMLLAKLIKSSLRPGARRSFKDLLFRDNLSIHYKDLLYSIDFSILVEFNGGFDIDVLSFGFIVRVIRIYVAAELFDTLLNIKRGGKWDRRQPFDRGIHRRFLLTKSAG